METDDRPSIAELQRALTHLKEPRSTLGRKEADRLLHRAAPALVEIAAAALNLDAAERALTAAREAGGTHRQELGEACACLAEHDAAIAKVRP